MTAKALQYAENQLGVHEVYQGTLKDLTDLDSTVGTLDKLHDQKRELNEHLLDREVELIDEMRSVHYTMSDTRFNTEMKKWKRKDAKLMAIQLDINKLTSEIQGLEYDADIMKLKIRTGCARLEELGGYLNYLASVKNNS